jgi:hypothetical protein
LNRPVATPDNTSSDSSEHALADDLVAEDGGDIESDAEEDDRLQEELVQEIPARFEWIAGVFEKFIPLLRYQKQFSDIRFYKEAEKQFSRALGFMEDCLDTERLENSPTFTSPTTWGVKHTTMFLQTRPPSEIH